MTPTLPRLPRPLRTAWDRIETPLDRYIQTSTLRAVLLVAGALTALFSLLEFVEQLSSVGQGRYRLADALVYVLLTAPARLLQVAPVSMLLGSLMGLGALGKNSELIALMGLGISENRIIGAALKLVVPITLVLFLLAEFVIPPAQQLAQVQRTAALAESVDMRADNSFWAQGDHQYLNVQRFDAIDRATEIDIYAFVEDGSLDSVIHADHADIRPDGTWVLANVLRKHIVDGAFETEHLAQFSWHSFMPPDQIRLLMLPPESMPPVALYRYVHALEQTHQQAIRYSQELWRKIGIPLSMVAMIMIAAPFVFGPPRSNNTGQQITIGAVFGIVFSLAQQIVGHLDLLLDLNPAVTALGPSLVLIGLAVYLFRRKHR